MTQALQITSTPDEWMAEVEHAILHAEIFRWSTDLPAGYKPTNFEKKNFTIVNQQLIEKFGIFHDRAVAHSLTKGEHEAAALVNFYVIWKYKLWKAEAEHYKTWTGYVQDVSSQPWSVSSSTIEHGVAFIDDALEKGITIRNVIGLLGKTPTAGKALITAPEESVPNKDYNSAAEILTELGPDEAGRAVLDWQGKKAFTGLSAVHDEETQTLYLEVRRTEVNGNWDKLTHTIEQVDKDEAEWIMRNFKIRAAMRAFK